MTKNLSIQFQQNLKDLTRQLPQSMAIAVSGGSDSMALLMLAKEWADEHEAKLAVLTVDHHLRKESSQEAEYVGLVCGQLGLRHRILDWDELLSPSDEPLGEDPRASGSRRPSKTCARGKQVVKPEGSTYLLSPSDEPLGEDPRVSYNAGLLRPSKACARWKQVVKSEGNIQSRARKARYDLMTSWCHENNISTLLTAHHLDDQVENFIIRLSRGSGLFGLLDHSFGLYNKINILRPLFNIPKKELQTYLTQKDIKWCEDPSNHNPKYQRSNVRQWLDQMPLELEPELFKERVLQSQRHLRCAADYIKRDLDRELQENVVFHENHLEYRMTTDPLIGHMTLSYLLRLTSGKDQGPRGEAVELLRKNLLEGRKKATLHGCVVISTDATIMIRKEAGRKKKT